MKARLRPVNSRWGSPAKLGPCVSRRFISFEGCWKRGLIFMKFVSELRRKRVVKEGRDWIWRLRLSKKAVLGDPSPVDRGGGERGPELSRHLQLERLRFFKHLKTVGDVCLSAASFIAGVVFVTS